MHFELERTRIDKIPQDRVLDELKRVAEAQGYVEFGKRHFDASNATGISASTVVRTYGSWSKAIASLRLALQEHGVTLKRRTRSPFTEQKLFDELERIWRQLGHRPSRNEWEAAEPRISYNTYQRHFNGWVNACLAFIEHKMGAPIHADTDEAVAPDEATEVAIPQRSRSIPLKTRLDVLGRDNFRCVLCGGSPATDVGVVLYLDHMKPFSKGSTHDLENLRTLCADRNLGKSNRDNV
jgi:Homing endonuclease associated repeat/HNH endonuclease